jgi:hypothetical protein
MEAGYYLLRGEYEFGISGGKTLGLIRIDEEENIEGKLIEHDPAGTNGYDLVGDILYIGEDDTPFLQLTKRPEDLRMTERPEEAMWLEATELDQNSLEGVYQGYWGVDPGDLKDSDEETERFCTKGGAWAELLSPDQERAEDAFDTLVS